MTSPPASSVTQATDTTVEGWRAELATLVPGVAGGTPLDAHPAAAQQLARALAEGHGAGPLSPGDLLNLLDALRGRGRAPGLPPAQIAGLLEALPVEWAAFDGAALGELFSAVLLLGKAPASALPPEEAGALVGRIFAAHGVRLDEDDLAAAVTVMWADGFAWGPAAGRFVAGAVPRGWGARHGAALVCRLAQACIDADELDLVDFEEVDRAEVDSHNPAVRIGALLEALTPVEDQTVALAAGVVAALRQTFQEGADGEDDGDDGGSGAPRPWQRSALFAGRVLAQLTGMQAPGGGGEWCLEEAVRLACRLCSVEGGAADGGGGGDWRAGRCQHAYFVGDALKQVRKEWGPEAVGHLVTALQSQAYYSAGGPAPRRIVSEVLEGLGADFTVVVGVQGAAPRQGRHGSRRVRPGTPSGDGD